MHHLHSGGPGFDSTSPERLRRQAATEMENNRQSSRQHPLHLPLRAEPRCACLVRTYTEILMGAGMTTGQDTAWSDYYCVMLTVCKYCITFVGERTCSRGEQSQKKKQELAKETLSKPRRLLSSQHMGACSIVAAYTRPPLFHADWHS